MGKKLKMRAGGIQEPSSRSKRKKRRQEQQKMSSSSTPAVSPSADENKTFNSSITPNSAKENLKSSFEESTEDASADLEDKNETEKTECNQEKLLKEENK